MAILPNNKPFSVPPAGSYYATIESAEMKQGKDTSKPMYLNLRLKLKDKEGKSAGTIFDILTESEAPLVKYKLKRFLGAIGVTFSGDFELKDLAKVCVGKEIIVDTKIEKGLNDQERAVVDATTNEVYYPLSEASEVFGESAEVVINAVDAADATDVIDEF